VAALKAGWDFQCAGVQLNRFCASGLEAVNMAAQKVRSGWEDLVVAGGVESMSRVPIGSDGGAWAHGSGDQQRHRCSCRRASAPT
jgi:acetyl-CoA C-acetyltransferase